MCYNPSVSPSAASGSGPVAVISPSFGSPTRAASPAAHLAGAAPGFSLLELLVVLVISGIMLSIATPRFGRFITRLEMDGAANTIVADLYHARMLAVREGEDVAVRFYKVSARPRCYSPRYQIVVLGTPERVVKHQDLGDGVGRGCLDVGAVRQVRFGPRGLPTGAMNRTVRVGRDGYEARFRMSLLGRVYREMR